MTEFKTSEVLGRRQSEVLGRRKVARAPSLTEQVTTALRKDIMRGVFERGGPLPSEQAMAREFGVSRTVMREAIARLKADGLVVTQQGRGIFVASSSASLPFRLKADLEDVAALLKIIELRIGFEVEAAGLAAKRRSSADLKRMRKALDDMAHAIEDRDLERGVAADVYFHTALCQATQNEHFASLHEFLSAYLMDSIHISRYRTSRAQGLERSVQAEHEAIFKAIEAGDAEAARASARAHIYNTRARVNGSIGDAI